MSSSSHVSLMEEVLKACKTASVNLQALYLLTWVLPTRYQASRAELWHWFRRDISARDLEGYLNVVLAEWANDMVEGLA